MVDGFLPQEWKEADQELRIEQVPLVIGQAEALRHGPAADRLQQGIPVKPLRGLPQDAVHQRLPDDMLTRFGDQAAAQIFQRCQVVEQNAAAAVRHLDLDRDLTADHLLQLPVGVRPAVQHKSPPLPARRLSCSPVPQKACPYRGAGPVVFILQDPDLAPIQAEIHGRELRKGQIRDLQQHLILIFISESVRVSSFRQTSFPVFLC